MVAIVGFLMLTVFDSNQWWKVLLYAIPTTLLNVYLMGMGIQRSLPSSLIAILQGLVAAFIAYLFGLTAFMRTTFGTLVGFALLLSLTEYALRRFFVQEKP